MAKKKAKYPLYKKPRSMDAYEVAKGLLGAYTDWAGGTHSKSRRMYENMRHILVSALTRYLEDECGPEMRLDGRIDALSDCLIDVFGYWDCPDEEDCSEVSIPNCTDICPQCGEDWDILMEGVKEREAERKAADAYLAQQKKGGKKKGKKKLTSKRIENAYKF